MNCLKAFPKTFLKVKQQVSCLVSFWKEERRGTQLGDDKKLEIPESLMNIVVDETTPQNAPLAAKYKRSFAYPSMKDRCPVILTKIVDQLHRDKQALVENFGEESQEEIKQAIGDLSQLKNALQTGKTFENFTSSDNDTDIWNDHLLQLTKNGVQLNYYEADWLFAECYLYRKIREIFATKKILNNLDPFSSSKKVLLNESIPAVVPLLKHLEDIHLFDSEKSLSKEEIEKELTQLFKCALWANRLDLSLSGGTATVQDSIFKIIEMWNGNLIIDDLDKVLPFIIKSSKSNKILAYVLDNTGMEALCDFCLADFVVSFCGVAEVKFRVKPIPWFVSDVTQNDFNYIIDIFSNHSDPLIKKFGDRWKGHIQSRRWSVAGDRFMCLGVPYSAMSEQDPELYNIFSSSDFVIFKGDLNYRKLLQDVNWEPTTPFSTALGKFQPAPLVTLRTNKADLICGLKEGVAESLTKSDSKWMVSGDFAVIQLYSP